MNKDAHLIFEAYKKRLTENTFEGEIDGKEFGLVKQRLRDAHNQYAVDRSLENANTLLRVIEKHPVKSPEAKTLKEDLIKVLDDIISGKKELNKEEFKTFAHRLIDLQNATIWSYGRSENAEEGSNEEFTIDTIKQAIEATLKPLNGTNVQSTSEGIIAKYLEDKGIARWGTPNYKKYGILFRELTDQSSVADKGFYDDYKDDEDEYTPEQQASIDKHYEELKAEGWERMEHGGVINNKGGDTLFYLWSGNSYMRGAALQSAISTAEEYGFKSVVLVPQG